MLHEDVLAQAHEYHSGRSTEADRAFLERHLETCKDCRTLYGRWRLEAPTDGFDDSVMARLGIARTGDAWMRGWAFMGTVAAALLVITAFYHPEKRWMESDALFAWTLGGESIHQGIRGEDCHDQVLVQS